MQYTIELTTTEDLALGYVAADQQDWIDNAVKNRTRIAIEEIVQLAVNKCMDTSIPVPATREETVALAFQQGWVKSAAQRNAETQTPGA
jgi:hypothetical protein